MDAADALIVVAGRQILADGLAGDVRRNARLTQIDVARHCGTTAAAVSRWESGTRTPRGRAGTRYVELLAELSEVSGVA